MKNLILALAMLCIGFWAWPESIAYALELRIGPYYSEISGPTSYMRSFGSDEPSRVAQAVCGATLARVNHQGRWIADFLTPCGFAATTVSGEADPTGIIGAEVVNFLGLRFSVGYDVVNSKATWGLGIDLLGAARQLAKP